MTKICAYLVEGFMEQEFINDACPGATVRRIELNGCHVSANDMADRISSLIATMEHRIHYFIVLFDLERRKVQASQFRQDLLRELEARGYDEEKVAVGVADRKIENWFLSSPTAVRKIAKMQWRSDNFDGKSADKIIKSELDMDYDKRIDGPSMLKSIVVSELVANSPSAAEFFSSLDHSCWWTSR